MKRHVQSRRQKKKEIKKEKRDKQKWVSVNVAVGVAVALLLGGCTPFQDPQETLLTNRTDTGHVVPAASDMVSCPKLPLPVGSLSEEQLGLTMTEWIRLYKSCSDRGDRLADVIREINGLKSKDKK